MLVKLFQLYKLNFKFQSVREESIQEKSNMYIQDTDKL